MSRKKRKRPCPYCGRTITATKAGAIPKHTMLQGSGRCVGSGRSLEPMKGPAKQQDQERLARLLGGGTKGLSIDVVHERPEGDGSPIKFSFSDSSRGRRSPYYSDGDTPRWVYSLEFVNCGSCKRCKAGGFHHGPYWYAYARVPDKKPERTRPVYLRAPTGAATQRSLYIGRVLMTVEAKIAEMDARHKSAMEEAQSDPDAPEGCVWDDERARYVKIPRPAPAWSRGLS